MLKTQYISQDGAVNRVDIESFRRQPDRVTLFARDAHEAGALADVPELLKGAGFPDIRSDIIDGQHALIIDRVPGRRLGSLLETLEKHGCCGSKLEERKPDREPQTAMQRSIETMKYYVDEDPLVLAGLLGIVGNMTQAYAAYLDRDWNKFRSAAIVNNIIASIPFVFGNGASLVDYDETIEDMRDFLAKEGYTIPEHAEQIIDQEGRSDGFLHGVYRYVSKNPVAVSQSFSALSNVLMIRSGLDESRAQDGVFRLVGGVTSLFASGIAIFSKERSRGDQEKIENPNPLQRIGMAIQERPLLFTGGMDMVMNAMNFADSLQMSRRNKQNLFGSPEGTNWRGQHMDAQAPLGERIAELRHNNQHSMYSGLGGEVASAVNMNPEAITFHGKAHDGIMGKVRDILHKNPELNVENERYDAYNPRHRQARAILDKQIATKEGDLQVAIKGTKQEKEQKARQLIEGSLKPSEVEIDNRAAVFGGIAATSWFLSGMMWSRASKSKIAGADVAQKDAFERLTATAAQMLLCLPKEERADAAVQIGCYYASNTAVERRAEEFIGAIADKVTAFEQNPWVSKERTQRLASETVTAKATEVDMEVDLARTISQDLGTYATH